MQTKDCPKVSIITCVYNGEKYISKLLDSVLNMGYPNIEHIIVNDGSTDSTEDIVMKYAELYKNKENSNLYIKYIKQENMGLGGATNTGLKQITGEYWTWINCDDWYEKEAFFEPIEMMTKKTKIDYVQMNGYYVKTNGISLIIKKQHQCFYNKKLLFRDYCYGVKFRYLLFICRTSSYRGINKNMKVYPSKYTQDVQFVNQIYGVLRGSYVKNPKWFFLMRDDSFFEKNKKNLSEDYDRLKNESIELLDVSSDLKKTLIAMYKEETMLNLLKASSLLGDYKKCSYLRKQIKKLRKEILFSYRFVLDKKLFLYILLALIKSFFH